MGRHPIIVLISSFSSFQIYLSNPSCIQSSHHLYMRFHSNAYKGDNNDTLSDPSKNKEMYDAFVKLRELGELQRSQVESIKLVTEQIRAVRIAPPAWNEEHEPNPMFDIALAEAKAMTEKHVLECSEAKLAWETLEDIAGNDSSAATKQAIDADEECLIEMMEACEAMEELNRALFLDKTKEDGRYHG
jgi:hypothetical protein